jgi:hypothetical protein
MKVPEKVLEAFHDTYRTLDRERYALEKALEAALEQLRVEMLGEEARGVLFDAHLHYQAEKRPTEDDWALSLLEAVLNHVLGEEGS